MQENNAYLQRKIATLNTPEMNVLLLNKAILCLERASEAMHAKNFQEYYDQSQKVVKIIMVMANALHEYAQGELLERQGAFFKTILQLLIQLNISSDEKLASEIIAMLATNRDAWKVLAEHEHSLHGTQTSENSASNIDRRT